MSAKKITVLAMFSALAFIAVALIRIPMFLFLSYEPKDAIITIAGFIFGPLSALLITVVVSVVEMVTISGTGVIGLLMNIMATAAFACPASYFFKKDKTIKSAIMGLLVGLVLMTGLMLFWNYLITPYYMGVPREEVVKLLIPVILPFNIVKASLNGILTILLYNTFVKRLIRSGYLEIE